MIERWIAAFAALVLTLGGGLLVAAPAAADPSVDEVDSVDAFCATADWKAAQIESGGQGNGCVEHDAMTHEQQSEVWTAWHRWRRANPPEPYHWLRGSDRTPEAVNEQKHWDCVAQWLHGNGDEAGYDERFSQWTANPGAAPCR